MSSSTFGAFTTLKHSIAASTAAYYAVLGDCDISSATESDVQIPIRNVGTFSNFGCYVDSDRAASTLKFRVATANGNQVITTGASPVGAYRDTTHTDTTTAGQLLSFVHTPGAGGSSSITVSSYVDFAPTTSANTVTMLAATGPLNFNIGSSTRYIGLNQPLAWTSGGGGTVELTAGIAGTLEYLSARQITNSRGAMDYYSVIGGASGNNTVHFAANGTGVVEDTTHTDTIGLANTIQCKLVSGTLTNNDNVGHVKIEFRGSSGKSQFMSGGTMSSLANNLSLYWPVSGASPDSIKNGTEAEARVQIKFGGSLSRLTLAMVAGHLSAASNGTLRVNGASTALTAGGNGSGYYTDTTHTVTTALDDYVCFLFSSPTSGSGSCSPSNISCACVAAAAYSLDLAAGSFTWTGSSAALIKTKLLDLGVGAYTVTGAVLGSARGYVMNAAPGSYTWTGANNLLEYHFDTYSLVCLPGAFAFSGAPLSTAVSHYLDLAPTSYALSWTDAVLSRDYTLNVSPFSVAWVGYDMTFRLSGPSESLRRAGSANPFEMRSAVAPVAFEVLRAAGTGQDEVEMPSATNRAQRERHRP